MLLWKLCCAFDIYLEKIKVCNYNEHVLKQKFFCEWKNKQVPLCYISNSPREKGGGAGLFFCFLDSLVSM